MVGNEVASVGKRGRPRPFWQHRSVPSLPVTFQPFESVFLPVLEIGPVELEWDSKVARLDGRPVELSAREWAVIEVRGRRAHSTVPSHRDAQ